MKSGIKSTMVGSVTGLINGIFGSGGGTLFVPFAEKFLKFPVHAAHATAVAVILPMSVCSSFVYLRGNEIDCAMLLMICGGGIVGGFVGAKTLKRLPRKFLKRLFGLFMIAAAIRMLL